MSPGRYRAWSFLSPDIDAPEEFSGLGVSPTGGIQMVEELASVRQSILLLLSTMPGERVMRPDYGCDLHRLIFAPNDSATAGLAIHYTRQAIEKWETRIEILYLDANPNPDRSGQLDIALEYRLKRLQRMDQITFSISLTGDQA